jgi:hypothetical protein
MMISTVTTTVTTVTTTVLAGSFALIATLMLLTFLIQKELISVAQGERWQRLSRSLNVVLLPLLLTFLAITVVEVMKAL